MGLKRFGGFGVAAMLACAALAAPALAQTVYPTAAGSNVRVPGTVPLQCNASGQLCAPVTAANPLQVSVGGGGSQQVVGNVASDAVDSGNPVKIGCLYSNAPAAVASGDRVDVLCNSIGWVSVQTGTGLSGVYNADGTAASGSLTTFGSTSGLQGFPAVGPLLFNGSTMDRQRGDTNGTVVQPALSSTFWRYAAAASGIVSSTADVAVKAAAGASVRNYVCTIDISHDVLSAVSEIVIKDNATVMWRGKLSTAVADVAAGAGKLTFTPCLQGTANTAVNVAMISSVTGGVYVNLTGYTGS